MENKKTNFFSLPKSKGVKITGGILLILWQIISGNFYLPISAEAIGYGIIPLAIVVFGGYLIYSGMKQKK